MNSKNILSITEARKNLFDIAEDVQTPSVHYILTEKGRPKVAIVSAEEYESWTETTEVKQIFPNLKELREKADKEYKTGQTMNLTDFILKQGYQVAEKPTKNYEVHSRTLKKRSKKSR
jgi:prevent-host-death family protein